MTELVDRSQLEWIVAGLSEGVILIEPDGTITYANEAALTMHGAKDLDELGRNSAEYRDRFVLRYRDGQPVAPGTYPLDRVIAGETFEDAVVIVKRPMEGADEWTHRIRSLVLTDQAGHPDCLVLIVTDVSEQYEAEDRFERAFAANPAPAVICRLSDLRYVKVNTGFLELTGFAREDVLGRSIYELDVLAGAEKRDTAVELLHGWQTIPQMEACLKLPNGSSRAVIVAGQPLELPGDEPCMLFSFADFEPRKKAEDALRQSEQRFATSFRLSPLPTTISVVEPNGDHRFIDLNEAFGQVFGHDAHSSIGRGARELGLWVDEEARRSFNSELKNKSTVRGFEAKLRTKQGVELDCLISADIVVIADRPCMLCAFQDITSRKRSESELIVAIEAVMTDASWFSRGIVEKLAALKQPARLGRKEPTSVGLDDLTGREREVLVAICRDLSDAQIGAELKLARNTVRNHVAAIYRKLNVNRRSAVVVWARERGIGGEPLPKRSRRR